MKTKPAAKPRITFKFCLEYARKIAAAAPDYVRVPEPKGGPTQRLPLLRFLHQGPRASPTDIHAYGTRFLYRTQQNGWAAIDALIEDGRLIGVALYPSQIAEQWNDSLRTLRRRRRAYAEFSRPSFLKAPEHNLHFVSFAGLSGRQPKHHIHLNNGLRPLPRAKLLTSSDVGAILENLRGKLAIHTQRTQSHEDRSR